MKHLNEMTSVTYIWRLIEVFYSQLKKCFVETRNEEMNNAPEVEMRNMEHEDEDLWWDMKSKSTLLLFIAAEHIAVYIYGTFAIGIVNI